MGIIKKTVLKKRGGAYSTGLKVLLGFLTLGALAGVGVSISAIANSTNNTQSIATIKNNALNASNQLTSNYIANTQLEKMVSDLNFIGTNQPLTTPVTTVRTTFTDNELVTKKYVDDQVAALNVGNDYTPTAELYTRVQADAAFATKTAVTALGATVGALESTAEVVRKLGPLTPTTELYTRTEADSMFATEASVTALGATVGALESAAEVDRKLGLLTLTTGLYTKTDADATFATLASVAALRPSVDALESAAEVDRKLGLLTLTTGLYTKTQADSMFATLASVAALSTNVNDNYDTVAEFDAKLAEYTKTSDLNFLPLSGGTITGPVSLAAVNGVLPIPTQPGDLTTKKYVDDQVGGLEFTPDTADISIPPGVLRIEGNFYNVAIPTTGGTPAISPRGVQVNTFYDLPDGRKYIIRKGDNPATTAIEDDYYYLEKATFSLTAGNLSQFLSGLQGGPDDSGGTFPDGTFTRITDYDNPLVTDKSYGNSAQNIGDIDFIVGRRYIFWSTFSQAGGEIVAIEVRYQANGSFLTENNGGRRFTSRTYRIRNATTLLDPTVFTPYAIGFNDGFGRQVYGVSSNIRVSADPAQLTV